MAGPIKTFMVDSLRVRVYANPESLYQEAAREVFSFLQDAMLAQGSASVILARSDGQIKLLENLSRFSGVNWAKITLFHTDEYLGLTAGHPASCRRFMQEKVESLMRLRTFHYLEGDSLQPIKECERYAQLLRAQKIDVCFVDLAPEGHLAMNSALVADFNDARSVKIVKLEASFRQQLASAGHFPDLQTAPQYAFTLTLPALCAAKRLLCLAVGHEKAQVIKDLLQGPVHPACPVSVLRKQANAILLLDAEAASLL